MLLPTEKNCFTYTATTSGAYSITIAPDGGLAVEISKEAAAWSAVSFNIPLSTVGLAVGDQITISCDELVDGVCISTRFMTNSWNLLGEAAYVKSLSKVIHSNIPSDTALLQMQIFTTRTFDTDLTLLLYPQVEKGSERTEWEPPASVF